MKTRFVTFGSVSVGDHFKARGETWMKLGLRTKRDGTKFNAFKLRGETIIIQMESTSFFYDQTLVQPIETSRPNNVHVLRART
jgi:hypothetical protein